jgi:hypothetical protein
MRRNVVRGTVLTLGVLLLTEPALAHVSGVAEYSDGGVPPWLTIATGGVIIGASFLFTSLLTDHEGIRMVNGWHLHAGVPASIREAVTRGLRAVGVLVLVLVVASGLLGPGPDSSVQFATTDSFAIMVVWIGWWAGYIMTVYLVGNSWPLFNPFRALGGFVPRLSDRSYPERLGAWPSVAGLLALVFVEVVTPVAQRPRFLAAVVLGYTVVTLAGVGLYGTGIWFDRVDPIARALRAYGRIAPIQRTGDGIALTLPTTALVDHRLREESGAAAFVVALLWVTTYDGLVATPAWETAISPLVAAGVPALLVYVVAIVGGFLAFYHVYRYASRRARDAADSYVTAEYLARYFAPALLPIAAGYHLAHFLAYFLRLSPSLLEVLGSPLSAPASASVLTIPGWFGTLQILLVLLGHVLAIWVAHSRAFELFPGIFKPIRSQYATTVVMIFYTMASLWVVVQPFGEPPFV